MTRRICLALAFLLSCATLAANADEAAIRQAIESRLGGVKVEGVQETPIGGIFEVRMRSREGLQIVYTDATASHIIDGNLIDLKTSRNITEERMRKLTSIEFDSLPLDLAVKVQRGDGRRVLAMFSDPYCPYCRRLEQSLLQIDDLTVYVFMYPVIRPDAADHSRAVWCSKDRARAWLDLAASERPKVPAASPNCANPVSKVLELGRSLRVNSTPTLYFANGERVAGGMQTAELKAKLDEIARLTKK